ncbi:MAG: DUF1569 domain-containing protein [Bacteroidia bacterium]|nr:DUF1569 domain-containing protein [Bacteroidia bacterium]
MTDILNTPALKNTFSKLKADAKPQFGKMSPQHIVEHLCSIIKISSGKKISKFYFTQEEADKLKAKLIYGDAELSPGIKNPALGDEPPALVHSDLNAALEELYIEITYFETHYKENPGITHTHPRMGELKHEEWHVVHNKHFAHHFRQFQLL